MKNSLTYSHLFSAKQFRVGYGHIKAREVVRLTATSALIHSHFNAKTLENDLAIITLPQNQLINTELVTPIAIARKVVELNENGTVASFGFENDAATTISEDLTVATQVVIDNQNCADAFNVAVHANQFCGQDPKVLPPPSEEEGEGNGDDSDNESSGENGENNSESGNEANNNNEGETNQDGSDWTNWSRRMGRVATNEKQQTAVCRGDTGSAIVRRTEQYIIGFGIVSRVPSGCNAERPALYTHLPAFTQWLEDATLGEVKIVDE